jgi:hypothetical protein
MLRRAFRNRRLPLRRPGDLRTGAARLRPDAGQARLFPVASLLEALGAAGSCGA